jgi:K+-transporting ATPase KdpF subunit
MNALLDLGAVLSAAVLVYLLVALLHPERLS